jgi:hypothetical protein
VQRLGCQNPGSEDSGYEGNLSATTLIVEGKDVAAFRVDDEL